MLHLQAKSVFNLHLILIMYFLHKHRQGLDLSEDENAEVVFAAKPDQLKIAEKTSNKRQRGKDEDKSAKVEAVKMCRSPVQEQKCCWKRCLQRVIMY
ncbi:hypothetical protein Tco_1050727 [Tanacetum coccineum]